MHFTLNTLLSLSPSFHAGMMAASRRDAVLRWENSGIVGETNGQLDSLHQRRDQQTPLALRFRSHQRKQSYACTLIRHLLSLPGCRSVFPVWPKDPLVMRWGFAAVQLSTKRWGSPLVKLRR